RISRPDLFNKWIGGVGVGLQLLNEHVNADADPLGPGNAIIFTIGSLSTLYPIVSKTAVLFRSPLTNDLGESYAGGRLSQAMRFAGLGAIVIKGQSAKSCFITISDEDVEIRKSGPLAYMYTSTVGRVLRQLIPVGPGRRSTIRIGQASEDLVKYGIINVDSFRHFGRLGAGAVMGAKGLKAIVISGTKDYPLDNNIDRRNYLKTYREIWEACVNTPVMRKYHVYGTPENILPLNELNALPTRNFQESSFDHADEISGEKFVESYLGRRVACNTCPVACIHVAILRERYGEDSPADVHSISVPYDFELIYALGSNLGIPDGKGVLELIEQVERYGMDAITTGEILAWMAEAREKGLINEKDTRGIEMRFGDIDAFIEVIKQIAYRDENSGELYWLAGEGIGSLVERYGGKDFAVAINNHPVAGYSTGPYTVFGHAIGGRHSHLDNAGYSLDQKALKRKYSITDAVNWLIDEEEWRNVLNSLVICLFAKNIYTPAVISDCFKNFKIEKTGEELRRIGREIQKLRIKTKIKFGMDYSNLISNLPERFFTMSTPHGKLSRTMMEDLYNRYREEISVRYGLELV
ncbi:MAG: aldehyde ferredoxin oxidoreductase C-terminal domain-containing protein, partial [Candidatus Hodarchaeales archaeon]